MNEKSRAWMRSLYLFPIGLVLLSLFLDMHISMVWVCLLLSFREFIGVGVMVLFIRLETGTLERVMKRLKVRKLGSIRMSCRPAECVLVHFYHK